MTLRTATPWLLLTTLLCLLAGQVMADATRIQLIELKGRSAEELIPLLRPVVEPGGALSGTGYRLIVRATEAQHAEIRRLLDELDRAPQRLLISVHMGELSQRERQSGSLQIQRQFGDAGIALGNAAPGDDRGLTIHQQDASGSSSIRHYSTRELDEASDQQQVQALEGEPAFIATGSERPYPGRVEIWRGPHGGSGGAVEMDYRQAATGFYAVANIRGDQVVVRISPQRESFDRHGSGIIKGQHIQTTVSGPLGSWLQIGSVGGSSDRQQSGIGRALSTQSLNAQPMWLKVDELR